MLMKIRNSLKIFMSINTLQLNIDVNGSEYKRHGFDLDSRISLAIID